MCRTPAVAIVGIGRWGKNLVRVFDAAADLRICCHNGDEDNRDWLSTNYPDVMATTEYEDVLSNDRIDAVVLATPIQTHHQLALAALEADKHVFVEKPMTAIGDYGDELVRAAERRNRILFVGFVFLYDPALVRLLEWDTKITSLIQEWQKLGSFDTDMVENLVCHDVAIAQRIFAGDLTDVSVTRTTGRKDVVDYLQVNLSYGHNGVSDISVNRLSPEKRKSVTAMTTSGEILVWTPGQLRIFNPETKTFEPVCRSGAEPLMVEARAFCRSIETNQQPTTDGEFGLAINRTLATIKSQLSEA